MLAINCINCKAKKKTETYAFTPSLFSKSLLARNLSVFDDLNKIQIGIRKTDAC